MKANNMLKGALLVATSLMIVSCVSCVHRTRVFSNDSKQVSEVRNLKGFEEIEINGSPTVYYSQADSFSVRVTGPSESVNAIITEVVNGSLTIRNRGKVGVFNVVMNGDDKAVVYVTSPDLVNVRLNGSGDFVGKNLVDTDEIGITLRGSGDISFDNIICDKCQIDLVGSGDVRMARLDTKDLSATLIGSGDIELHEWNVQTTDLHLKGSGDIDANLEQGCKNVSCELHGSGDITLTGSVDHYSIQKSGSGDIDVDDLDIRD